MNRLDYWQERIGEIADGCGLVLTVGQSDAAAKLIADAHRRFERLRRRCDADDAQLPPDEALTYILETIRDRGWEMPEQSRLTRQYVSGGESLYVRWDTDCAEMNILGMWELSSIKAKVVRPTYAEIRRWPDVTKASIDAALGFIFGENVKP